MTPYHPVHFATTKWPTIPLVDAAVGKQAAVEGTRVSDSGEVPTIAYRAAVVSLCGEKNRKYERYATANKVERRKLTGVTIGVQQ